jgi:ABC-2 type transport system permease protein
MAAHAIADAAAGRYGAAAIALGVSGGTVALLIWLWILALRRALERPDTSTAVRGRDRSAEPPVAVGYGPAGPRVLRRAHASRAMNAAGRELRYYLRDPRRKQQLVNLAMPVFLILANSHLTVSGPGAGTAAGAVAGIGAGSSAVPGLPVWPAVLGGAIAGMFSSANQFGMDGSALWMNVVATARWQDLRADIAGKNLAGAVITVPVFAALYAVVGALTGNGRGAATAFAMAICALGATSAVATVVSVLLPVPVPERRSSAFSSGGAGQGCLAALATVAGLGIAVAAMMPVFVLHSRTGTDAWLLVVAPGYGAALAWGGRRAAAVIGFRRLPEVLAAVGRAV